MPFSKPAPKTRAASAPKGKSFLVWVLFVWGGLWGFFVFFVCWGVGAFVFILQKEKEMACF